MQGLAQPLDVAKVVQVAARQRVLAGARCIAAQQQLLEGPHAHDLRWVHGEAVWLKQAGHTSSSLKGHMRMSCGDARRGGLVEASRGHQQLLEWPHAHDISGRRGGRVACASAQ